jgi:hypothetical protein
MTGSPALTLRLWSRRTRRFLRWFGTRDRKDRLTMWHLDRLAHALATNGWRIKRRFNVSPATLRVSPAKHSPAAAELTAIHFGVWVYVTRSSPLPIPCADLAGAVAEVEHILSEQLDTPDSTKAPPHGHQH